MRHSIGHEAGSRLYRIDPPIQQRPGLASMITDFQFKEQYAFFCFAFTWVGITLYQAAPIRYNNFLPE